MKTFKINQIEYKRILGRNVRDAGKRERLALFWGASALEVCVHAKDVWVNLSSDYSSSECWLAVEINGVQVSRFIVPKEEGWICLARNLNPQKDNLISLIKDTQAMSGDEKQSLFINGIGLDDQGSFIPLKERKLMIEFIGDSITSGEGLCGSPDEMEWIPQWFCASKTYARQTARALDADWSVLSQCGWGIKWGWDGNTNSSMLCHYENVCSLMFGDYQKALGAQDSYDFKRPADLVVVNLGTNDNGAFFQPAWKDSDGKENLLFKDEKEIALPESGNRVKEGVKEFLALIRKHNPSAKIVWVWGMIKLKTLPPYILKGIDEFKNENSDSNVFALELDAMEDVEKNDEDKGSRGHPGPKTHKLAAEKLTAFLKYVESRHAHA